MKQPSISPESNLISLESHEAERSREITVNALGANALLAAIHDYNIDA